VLFFFQKSTTRSYYLMNFSQVVMRGGGDLAHLAAASSHRMFLEDTQIDLPDSVDAIAREWSIHGIADQSVRLFVGDTLASPSTVFQIVDFTTGHFFSTKC
jgi:hypothetical protein